MEMHFTPDPELDAWLANTAARQGRSPEAVVSEILMERMSHESWLAGEVKQGMDDIAAGRFVEHDAAKAHFAELRKQQPASR